MFGKIYTCFLELQSTTFNLSKRCEKSISQINPEQSLLMFGSGDSIFFASRRSNSIYRFDTASRTFKRGMISLDLTLAAMCGNEDYIYIIDNFRRNEIIIYNSDFYPKGKILTGLKEQGEGVIDICVTTLPTSETSQHTIALCLSNPASVRVVNQERIVWQLDSQRCSVQFNPSSITSSATGQIYIADQLKCQVRGNI